MRSKKTNQSLRVSAKISCVYWILHSYVGPVKNNPTILDYIKSITIHIITWCSVWSIYQLKFFYKYKFWFVGFSLYKLWKDIIQSHMKHTDVFIQKYYILYLFQHSVIAHHW